MSFLFICSSSFCASVRAILNFNILFLAIFRSSRKFEMESFTLFISSIFFVSRNFALLILDLELLEFLGGLGELATYDGVDLMSVSDKFGDPLPSFLALFVVFRDFLSNLMGLWLRDIEAEGYLRVLSFLLTVVSDFLL